MSPLSRPPAVEAGSFRDPDSRVFLRDGAVFRALSREGWEDWEAFAATPQQAARVGAGKIVSTEPAELDPLPDLARRTPAVSLTSCAPSSGASGTSSVATMRGSSSSPVSCNAR